jgi:hypothetical protein
MSKVLDATCVNHKVTCEGVEVPNVTVLSEGVSASSGLLILEDDRKTYVARTSPDLKSTLEKVISALGQIATALTAIDTNNYIISSGPDVHGGPRAVSNIASLNSLVTDLTTLKDALK